MIIDESALGYVDRIGNGSCDVIVGLDFGTSATKVVIRLPDLPGSPAFAVDFGDHAHSSTKYLLPTKLWITGDSECHLSRRNGSTVISDIKLELFARDEALYSERGATRQGIDAKIAAVAYLSLVLRYVRTWFLRSKVNIIGEFATLNWSLNLGVPSPCVEDTEENRIFRAVGQAAWMASVFCQRIDLTECEKQLQYITEAPESWDNEPDAACDFDIVPEIAGGAVGYALSELRREGLHVMIDVGASTVDVCSFMLHNPSRTGDHYSILTADVKPFGSIGLHAQRIGAIVAAYRAHARNLRSDHDPMEPIADDMSSYLPDSAEIERAVADADEILEKNVTLMLHRVIRDLKVTRAPMENVWRERLPVLLIGGGSRLPFYEGIVDKLSYFLERFSQNDGIALTLLPVPESLSDEFANYHRLAVAWGLSYRALDIGEIVPADRIENIPPPARRPWESFYVSKDQT